MASEKKSMKETKRHLFQGLWFLATNSYMEGFKTGKIYQGKMKNLCVPGMNCYSCPGAKGACPIGALQAVIGNMDYKFSFYVVGFLFFIGALMGQGSPYFCKLICPVGMLEGGLPLVLKNESMKGAVGFLYAWKGAILAATIFLSILIYRPFCKYICPLGAVYSLFNPISVFKYRLDDKACIQCGACARACKMNVNPVENENSAECIRCGQCEKACPTGAITKGLCMKQKTKAIPEN